MRNGVALGTSVTPHLKSGCSECKVALNEIGDMYKNTKMSKLFENVQIMVIKPGFLDQKNMWNLFYERASY